MKEIKITQNEANQRLDKFLLKYMNKASKGFIYKMLRKKRIKYNRAKAEGSEILHEGDSLQFYLAEDTMAGFMEEKTISPVERHFGIVYEDEHVLFVAKPAGLLTHPEKPDEKDTLIDQILYYLYEKKEYIPSPEISFTPAVCNRLDRNTSGIVLAGKDLMSVQGINETISKRELDKFYVTLVKGEIKESGEIRTFLSKDNKRNKMESSLEMQEGGKQGVTRYRPIKIAQGYTLLEIQLITGKTHQIRAHMQAIGHPIVGDRKYGEEEINTRFRQKYGLSHQFLHARSIVWHADKGALSYLHGKAFHATLPKKFFEICKDLFGKDAVDFYGLDKKEEEKG